MAFEYSKILPRTIGILRIFSIVLAVLCLICAIFVVNKTGIAMKSNQKTLLRLETERDTLKSMTIKDFQLYKKGTQKPPPTETEFNKRYGSHETKILPLAEMRSIRNQFKTIIGTIIIFLIYYTLWFLLTRKYKVVVPPNGFMWKIDLVFHLIGGFILYSIAVNLVSLVPFAREAQARALKMCEYHLSYAGNKPMEVEFYYTNGRVHYILLRCVGKAAQGVRIFVSGATVFLSVVYMFIGFAKIAVYKYRKASVTVAPSPTASNTDAATKPPVGAVDNWTGECL